MKFTKTRVGLIFSLVIVTFLFTACASGPRNKRLTRNITSAPSGAEIYSLDHKGNKVSSLGKTPVSSATYALYYNRSSFKAEKKGYLPQVKSSGSAYVQNVHFNLMPMPKHPDPPKVVYPDPKSVAVSPLDLNSNKKNNLKITRTKNIAIMKFKEPSGSGAGSLIADSLILNLQVNGFSVIDREQIEKLMREQGLVAGGRTNLTDLEMSKELGKILKADYFIYGAITEYTAKSENISLSPVISDEERLRYDKEQKEYIAAYEQLQLDIPRIPKSIQEWEMEYTSKPKSSYINIARVGVSAKIVDIKSGQIVWVGIANLSDQRLHKGMKRIADAMIEDITTDKKTHDK